MEILFSAFLLSLVLVGIHAYFGLEIIRRGIIFTDLAVGQAAALGAAVSLFFWDGRFLYGCSLLAALLGAMWIALASGKGRFPEAFIGLVYALGISAVFLLLSKSPHGTEEFQRLLVSDLLYVSLDQVAQTAGLVCPDRSGPLGSYPAPRGPPAPHRLLPALCSDGYQFGEAGRGPGGLRPAGGPGPGGRHPVR